MDYLCNEIIAIHTFSTFHFQINFEKHYASQLFHSLPKCLNDIFLPDTFSLISDSQVHIYKDQVRCNYVAI